MLKRFFDQRVGVKRNHKRDVTECFGKLVYCSGNLPKFAQIFPSMGRHQDESGVLINEVLNAVIRKFDVPFRNFIERIDNRISRYNDFFLGDAFRKQVLCGISRRCTVQISSLAN